MKTIEQKARAYDEALDRAKVYWRTDYDNTLDIKARGTMEHLFPELTEDEDEKTRKEILEFFQQFDNEELRGVNISDWIAWLKKQGDNLVKNGYTDNKDVIKYANKYSLEIWHKLMDNFKNIKDYHIGCNDVSDIVLNAIIDTYNWLEKHGKKEFTFKSIPRLLEMIEPTDRAKSYCQKLIDSLVKEGYTADAKIVDACLKQMNGENVAMAVMDKKPLIIIPKFRVGDEVITKNEESLTITKIDKEGYWSNDLFICGFDDSDEWELVEQRPEWGEEDKQNLNAVLSYINDEYLRRWLKDAIHKKYDKHTEWSEEDESMYTRTLGILGKCYMGQLPTKVEEELNWIKYRLKYLIQQDQWKPSKEQIRTLEYYMHNLVCSEHKEVLFGLYEQLKKLKEE